MVRDLLFSYLFKISYIPSQTKPSHSKNCRNYKNNYYKQYCIGIHEAMIANNDLDQCDYNHRHLLPTMLQLFMDILALEDKENDG
jgi:hypothetical protein